MSTCTLVVEDEVNCFFSGLSTRVQSKLQSKFTYVVPGYWNSHSYKMGRWDGKKRLWAKGWAYTNLLDDDVFRIIEAEGYELSIDDRRTDPAIAIDFVDEDMVFGEKIKLRDYQVAAVNTALTNRSGILKIATGGGKSYICGVIAKLFSVHGKVVVIVPSVDLVNQTAESFRAVGIEKVGVFSGNEKIVEDVLITTWQSLQNYPELLEGVVALLCDEAHGAKAETLFNILTVAGRNIPFRYGFTGTIPDDDLAADEVKAVLGPVIFELGAYQLQQNGVLSSSHINILKLNDKAHVKPFSDYHSENKWLTSDKARLKWLSACIIEIAKTGNTLILVQNISTGKMLCELIGDGAVFLSGSTSTKDRKKHYKSVGDMDGKILICTKGIASTGIDIPRIFNLVLFELGKSFIEIIQSIGRSLRRAEDKDHAEIYDICSNLKYSSRHSNNRKKYYDDAKYPYSIHKVDY